MKHTKLPWRKKHVGSFDDPGHVLVWLEGGTDMRRVDYKGNFTEDDAEFIVRACNLHDELVRALKRCVAVCASEISTKSELIGALTAAKEALSKATN